MSNDHSTIELPRVSETETHDMTYEHTQTLKIA